MGEEGMTSNIKIRLISTMDNKKVLVIEEDYDAKVELYKEDVIELKRFLDNIDVEVLL